MPFSNRKYIAVEQKAIVSCFVKNVAFFLGHQVDLLLLPLRILDLHFNYESC